MVLCILCGGILTHSKEFYLLTEASRYVCFILVKSLVLCQFHVITRIVSFHLALQEPFNTRRYPKTETKEKNNMQNFSINFLFYYSLHIAPIYNKTYAISKDLESLRDISVVRVTTLEPVI